MMKEKLIMFQDGTEKSNVDDYSIYALSEIDLAAKTVIYQILEQVQNQC